MIDLDRRAFLATLPAAVLASRAVAAPSRDDWAAKLLSAAESQVGVTTIYDPAYVRLAYPGGDVPLERGVCTDVVIRAYRSAFGVDLQALIHEDMRAAFSAYPKTWAMQRPDRNIDHRRVPNLETFLTRRGGALPITKVGADFRPGDLVTQRLPKNLPHIAIVTARPSGDGARPLVVHNIGAGARIEDTLFAYPIVGRFRFAPDA